MKTSMKKIKQIAITSLALSGVLTCAYPKFCQNNSSSFAYTQKYNLTSLETGTSQTAITYLKSPELVATDGENLFVYDSFTKGLMEFNCSSSPTLLAESTEQKEILSLQFSGSFLYCLAKNSTTGENEVFRITKTNGSLTYTKVQTRMANPTLFAVETKLYTTAEDPSISTSQEVLYLLDDSKTLNVETIKESGQNPSSTYVFDQYAKLKSDDDTTNSLIVQNKNNTTITSIQVVEDGLIMSYFEKTSDTSASTKAFKLVYNSDANYYNAETDSNGSTIYYFTATDSLLGSYSAPNSSIVSLVSLDDGLILLSTNGNLHLVQASGTKKVNLKSKINSTYKNRFTSLSFSSITQVDGAIYITDPNNQVIFKLTQNGTTENVEIFMENITPTPSTSQVSEHKFIKVNQTAELYATPFSINASETIPSGTHLVILAEDDEKFKDLYYCLYTTKTANHYLYLKKTTSVEFLQKTPVATPVKTLGSSVPIFALPSTIEDSENLILERLQDNAILTQASLQTVKNSHGESFYVVSTPSGNTGYVRYTQINSSKNLIATQKVKCNGRTKRETKLFLAPSPDDLTSYSDEEIAEFETLDIENNTRVKLLEKISAGSTYTPAVYQNDSGQVYYGYILTEDIKSDDLTPLQIIGLALVGVNIILLIVIIAFRKRYTSSSNPKSASGENRNNKNTDSENSTNSKNRSKNSTSNLKFSENNSNNTQTSSSGNFNPTSDTSTTIDNATKISNSNDYSVSSFDDTEASTFEDLDTNSTDD